MVDIIDYVEQWMRHNSRVFCFCKRALNSRKYVPPATSSDVHLVWNHIRATTVILKVVFKFCYQLVFFLKKTDAY
ncbi:hypothetical protein SORBI_3010G089350 [Sorghum bicolor]|uniref:Uncharacterized protein n=1 Tax=Sorghum bicolor TaxID=4558 RepID=A0A1W0VS18_SORBI|nr:hypothetical protein SORBI_3010G089350 [Sorghum bicolor]